jgi:Domain of unknown function (DUF4112)
VDGKPPRNPDAERMLARFRALANLLDNQFRVPGTNWRFGIDPLLGLIPGLGDIAGAMFAIWSVVLARKLGAPRIIQAQMLTNIALDMVGGAVPIVGDLFDMAFKAHARNRLLLDAWLETPDAAAQTAHKQIVRKPVLLLIAIAVVGLAAAALTLWLAVLAFGWLMSLGMGAGAA